MPVPHLRVAFDLAALVLACYLAARAWRLLRPVAFGAAIVGVAGTLATYYGLVLRGWRAPIHVDIAYACMVVVFAVVTRGDISRVAPEKYLRSPEDRRSHQRVQLGPAGLLAVLGLFFLIEFLSYGTLLA